jgi:hypothetical protein
VCQAKTPPSSPSRPPDPGLKRFWSAGTSPRCDALISASRRLAGFQLDPCCGQPIISDRGSEDPEVLRRHTLSSRRNLQGGVHSAGTGKGTMDAFRLLCAPMRSSGPSRRIRATSVPLWSLCFRDAARCDHQGPATIGPPQLSKPCAAMITEHEQHPQVSGQEIAQHLVVLLLQKPGLGVCRYRTGHIWLLDAGNPPRTS